MPDGATLLTFIASGWLSMNPNRWFSPREPDRAALAGRVARLVQPGDLVLALGAGDITTLADELAPLLGRVETGDGGGAGDGEDP